MTIFKYGLNVTDAQTVKLPIGAEILAVQVQNDAPYIWALVHEDRPAVSRFIEIFGTGHPVTEGVPRRYIGTFQLNGGSLVYHVFERTTEGK